MDCSRGLAAQSGARRQGYSLGGERPDEVLSLSREETLNSWLQFQALPWPSSSSSPHLALQSGIEILGHLAHSSSEFIATNNGVRPGSKDQGGSSASHPERGTARETNYREEINLEDLEKLKDKNRENAAKSLGFGLTKFKRICRDNGIADWKKFRVSSSIEPRPNFGSYRGSSPSIPPCPNLGSDHVLAPADPNGENNPSPTSNTQSTNGQISTDIEMGGPNSEPKECLPNSFENPSFQNMGNGSIAEFENSTTFDDSHYGHDRDADIFFSDVFDRTEAERISDDLLELGFIGEASTQIPRENMGEDRRSFLVAQEVPLPVLAPSQDMPTAADTMQEEPLPHLALSQDMPTAADTMESSEYLRDPLASVVGHRIEKNHCGTSNLIDPSCSNLAPSQPMQPTIPHMTPLLTERQDSRPVKLYATYGQYQIKLHLPLMPGIMELKQAVSKQLGLGLDSSFEVLYMDERGEWILMTDDEEVRELLQLTSSENQVSKRLVIKVPNTHGFL